MCPVARCRRGLRRDPSGSALPRLPQSVSRGTWFSRLHWFAFATACQVARPPGRIGPGFPGPPGTFTSRLPAGRSPFPPLDMTTTATGLLCWRDFHPQEWQLASLHRIKPVLAEKKRRLSRLRGRGCGICRHGVISAGAPTPVMAARGTRPEITPPSLIPTTAPIYTAAGVRSLQRPSPGAQTYDLHSRTVGQERSYT